MKRILALTLLASLMVGLAFAQVPDDDDEADEAQGDGRAVLTIDNGRHLGPITGLTFTPDGKTLISCGLDRTVQEWDVASGQRRKVHRLPTYAGLTDELHGVGLAGPPGDLGASVVVGGGGIPGGPGGTRAHRVFLLNRSTGKITDLDTTGLKDLFVVEAVAATGEKAKVGRVASSRGDSIIVHSKINQAWKERAKPDHVFREAKQRFRSLAFSPDGQTLAAASMKVGGLLCLYDMKTGKPIARNTTTTMALCVAWDHEDKQLVTGHRSGEKDKAILQVWNAKGKAVKSFTRGELSERMKSLTSAYLVAAAFRQNGELIAVFHWGEQGQIGAELVIGVNLQTGKSRDLFYRGSLTTPHPGIDEAGVPLAISPNDRWAAISTAPRAGRIAWIDLTEKQEATFSGPPVALRGPVGWHRTEPEIAWSTLLTKDLNVALNLKTLQGRGAGKKKAASFGESFISEVHKAGGWSVRHNDEKKNRYVEVAKGKTTVKSDSALRWIETFTINPAGPKPWVGWSDRRSVYASDVKTGKTMARGMPMRTRAQGMAASPDGKYLLASTSRGLLRIYRIEGAEGKTWPLLTVYAEGPEWVAWTQEGYYAATPGGEKLMGWTVSNGYDRAASFYPASHFRKKLYRPELIARVLEVGSVEKALAAVGQKAAKVEDLLPPEVEIVAVTGDPVKEKLEVKVRAKARSPGQLIKSVRLLLNGRPAPGTVLELKGEKEVEETLFLDLPPGKHDITALVRSADASGTSAEVRQSRVGDRDARLASLFIGINQYQNKDLTLNAAVPDAKALAKAVQKNAGKPLFDKVDKPQTLLDGAATKKAILAEIEKIRAGGGKSLGSNDLAIISFAGHGIKKGNEFYLLPVEADENKPETTCISGTELKKALAGWPCQVLLVLDACHSNAGAKALAKKYKAATDDAARELTDDDVSVVVLSAAMGHEKAQETAGANPRGLFSKRLEEALAAGPTIGRNPADRCVYLHHAFSHIFDMVKDDSNEQQHPFLSLPWTVESFPLVYKGK